MKGGFYFCRAIGIRILHCWRVGTVHTDMTHTHTQTHTGKHTQAGIQFAGPTVLIIISLSFSLCLCVRQSTPSLALQPDDDKRPLGPSARSKSRTDETFDVLACIVAHIMRM